MSGYNLLSAFLTCPRCAVAGEVTAEFRFGLLDFREYSLGDIIEWGTKGLRFPPTRPEGGDYVGPGYVDCPNCGKDFWVVISVIGDVITSMEVDHEKEGYK